MIHIERISGDQAEKLCREITATLPEYFGLPGANEHYAIGVQTRINLAAKIDDKYIGLISMDFPYPSNSNIYWVAILPGFHRQGIGKKLLQAAHIFAHENGAKTMTVETLAPFESDDNYLRTYNFYLACGFTPLLNLKPQGYEWNMVYMVKTLAKPKLAPEHLSITSLKESDIPILVKAFAEADLPKPTSTFGAYLQEQVRGERLIWLAYIEDQFAGYITLKWQSKYESFANSGIPEIMDLNVLPSFRKLGVGSKLLECAEKEAATRSNIVGIGVGLYGGSDGGYGAAQKLYVKHGYIPNGKGVSYNYKQAAPGMNLPLDDDLVLWFTKKLL